MWGRPVPRPSPKPGSPSNSSLFPTCPLLPVWLPLATPPSAPLTTTISTHPSPVLTDLLSSLGHPTIPHFSPFLLSLTTSWLPPHHPSQLLMSITAPLAPHHFPSSIPTTPTFLNHPSPSFTASSPVPHRPSPPLTALTTLRYPSLPVTALHRPSLPLTAPHYPIPFTKSFLSPCPGCPFCADLLGRLALSPLGLPIPCPLLCHPPQDPSGTTWSRGCTPWTPYSLGLGTPRKEGTLHPGYLHMGGERGCSF